MSPRLVLVCVRTAWSMGRQFMSSCQSTCQTYSQVGDKILTDCNKVCEYAAIKKQFDKQNLWKPSFVSICVAYQLPMLIFLIWLAVKAMLQCFPQWDISLSYQVVCFHGIFRTTPEQHVPSAWLQLASGFNCGRKQDTIKKCNYSCSHTERDCEIVVKNAMFP